MTTLYDAAPYLEHFPEPGGAPHRIALEPLPFRLGRSPSAQFTIFSPQISKEHSEIFRAGREFRIRDLDSMNGTYVNGQRIKEAPLVTGDIIHVAHKELRFGVDGVDTPEEFGVLNTQPVQSEVPPSLIRGSKSLREMLAARRGRTAFQPILRLDGGEIVGYEALGRGTHPELSPNPIELFALAGQCNLACDLSGMFRLIAARDAARLPDRVHIFFNLHPAEIGSPGLLDSLAQFKAASRPDHQLVLEIHEGAVAAVPVMRRLRDQLRQLGIGLAYDDFGAGQSRLRELSDVPPDFVKFDLGLVRDIDTRESGRSILQALNRVIVNLGIKTIAEGIETPEEARVCMELGCQFGQGYFFGRPQGLELLGTVKEETVRHSGR